MQSVSIYRRTFLSLVSTLPFAPKLAAAPRERAPATAAANHVVFDTQRLDGVTLLGMPEDEALALVLAPVRMTSFDARRSTYLCGDPHLRVVEFQDGRLSEYQVAPRCGARTQHGVRVGDPLRQVVDRYGPLQTPQGRRARTRGARGAVVVHRRSHSTIHDRIWASYPREGVVFQLGRDRRVASITVKDQRTWRT